MNVIELYKKLPGSNCGECGLLTCMAFAMSVTRGETGLSQCPSLPEEAVDLLKGSVNLSDWREELIAKLGQEIKGISFREAAEGIGAEMRGDALQIKCLGRDFLVRHDGAIESPGHVTPWDKILILNYIKARGMAALTGKWVAYRQLKGGMVKDTSFRRDCEEPLNALFDARFGEVAASLKEMGAHEEAGFPSQYSWKVSLLPKVPVMVLYWPSDEEFDSKVSILFDSTADMFLDCESLIFLLEGFVKNIEMMSS